MSLIDVGLTTLLHDHLGFTFKFRHTFIQRDNTAVIAAIQCKNTQCNQDKSEICLVGFGYNKSLLTLYGISLECHVQ